MMYFCFSYKDTVLTLEEVDNPDFANQMLQITLYYTGTVSAMFFLPLSYLVVIQTQNMVMSTTTYLRFSKFAKYKNRSVTDDYFLKSIKYEEKEEKQDFNSYNSGLTNISKRSYDP